MPGRRGLLSARPVGCRGCRHNQDTRRRPTELPALVHPPLLLGCARIQTDGSTSGKVYAKEVWHPQTTPRAGTPPPLSHRNEHGGRSDPQMRRSPGRRRSPSAGWMGLRPRQRTCGCFGRAALLVFQPGQAKLVAHQAGDQADGRRNEGHKLTRLAESAKNKSDDD